ncbi:MAG TPA: hypothetical protein V6D08_21200 [Candidatus Obscuribacterales bacterium]
MTLNTILHRSSDYEALPAGSGEWYVATDLAAHKAIEDLNIEAETGAIVLECRKGFWNGNWSKQDIELLLWGSPEQLMAAQQRFKLQPLVDAQLDRPEIYWG